MTKKEFFESLDKHKPPFTLSIRDEGSRRQIYCAAAHTQKGRLQFQACYSLRRGALNAEFDARMETQLSKFQRWLDEYHQTSLTLLTVRAGALLAEIDGRKTRCYTS